MSVLLFISSSGDEDCEYTTHHYDMTLLEILQNILPKESNILYCLVCSFLFIYLFIYWMKVFLERIG